MRAKSSIPCRNKSPYGWWLVSYIVRFEYRGLRPKSPRSKCLAWENTIIVRAKSREVAYRKAISCAKLGCGNYERYGQPPGRLGKWVFEGFTSMNPIYEPLEHGSEISWTEHRGITLGKLRKHLKPKSKLEVFDDHAEA